MPETLFHNNITDRLHIGNRWMGLSGLAMYDNSARVHDPVMPRFLTSDNRAVDYTWLSPFSHCAGNPANMVDWDGNAIKLYGTSNAIEKTLTLLSNSIGNYYNLSVDDNYHVTMELNPLLKSKENLTKIQNKLVNRLESMVNDDFEMYLHTFDNTQLVTLGNADRHYIDVGDMLNVSPDFICSPESILWHELVEQQIYQKMCSKEDDITPDKKEENKNAAHRSACNFESVFSDGRYTHLVDRDQNSSSITIKVKDNQALQTYQRIIYLLNGNIPPQ
ncbi:hypothetical protein [Muribaculum intestinale]|uniref:hypothetical protein n=1 Tax=Muribaculum intestinale TaxID=1796646 RepID=UPI002625A321|nr:hypothetical protein [Muribaculum intestinale]